MSIVNLALPLVVALFFGCWAMVQRMLDTLGKRAHESLLASIRKCLDDCGTCPRPVDSARIVDSVERDYYHRVIVAAKRAFWLVSICGVFAGMLIALGFLTESPSVAQGAAAPAGVPANLFYLFAIGLGVLFFAFTVFTALWADAYGDLDRVARPWTIPVKEGTGK